MSPPSCPLAPAPHDLGILSRLVAAIQVQLPASPVALKPCALQWALPGAQLPTRLPGLGVVPGQLAVGYQ